MTKLFLDIQPSPDCTGIRVKDISVWENIGTVTNIILEIKGPGQNCFKQFTLQPSFDRTFTCGDLNLCCSDCTEGDTQLPDGNYEIKLSYAPNLHTMVEFNHFRNCIQFKKYLKTVCSLFESRSSLTQKEFTRRSDELFRLKEYMNSAKYSAEECLNIVGGLDLYEEVEKKLNRIVHGDFCKDC